MDARARMQDLFVDGGLGNGAMRDVLDQAAIPAHKPDVQLLLGAIPLAADHHAVPIAVRLRTADHRVDFPALNAADALEQIDDLPVLETKLAFVSKMLVLAAAAAAEILALRFYAIRRRHDHFDQSRPRESFFYLGHFRHHLLARNDEGHEDDEIIEAGHALATKGEVGNRQVQPLARLQVHRGALVRLVIDATA